MITITTGSILHLAASTSPSPGWTFKGLFWTMVLSEISCAERSDCFQLRSSYGSSCHQPASQDSETTPCWIILGMRILKGSVIGRPPTMDWSMFFLPGVRWRSVFQYTHSLHVMLRIHSVRRWSASPASPTEAPTGIGGGRRRTRRTLDRGIAAGPQRGTLDLFSPGHGSEPSAQASPSTTD